MSGPDCLDAALARDLLAGELSDERRDAAEAHVETCDRCLSLLMTVEREQGERTEAPTMLEAGGTAAVPRRTLAAGDTVDHFEILRLLGRGGMGEVYLAEDTELGRQVALKVIAPEMLGSHEALEQFRHEARATARFSHPNIVHIYAIGRHRGAPYVALEYVEGRTLRDRLREGRLSPDEALRIALAIVEAVAAAHGRGVWHRDLKPNNVLLGDDGRPRVLDFGLAKIAGHAGGSGAVERSALAVEATTSAGTPLYMAPEQWRGDASSGATDVWALGVLVFELFTGEHPIVSAEERGLAAVGALVARQRATGGELAPGLELASVGSPRLASLVRRCLSLDAAARPTADDLRAELRALAEPPPATSPAVGELSSAPPSAPRAAASKRAPRVALAALVTVGAAVAVYFGLRGRPAPPAGPEALHASDDAPAESGAVESGATGAGEPGATGAVEPSAHGSTPASADPSAAVGGSSIDDGPPAASASVRSAPSAPAAAASAAPVVAIETTPRCRSQCQTYGRCQEIHGGCDARSDADCARSERCKTFGACAMSGRECAPRGESDCRRAAVCHDRGKCTFRDGWCYATQDADCRASSGCKTFGQCQARVDECQAGSDADCAASDRCKTHGTCREKSHHCRATDDAGCAAAGVCRAEGLCGAGYLQCLATEAGCQASTVCRKQGLCHEPPPPAYACVK